MALILHIGTHKTGTTLLQRFAHRHRRGLRKVGLEYPAWREWLGIRGRYAHHDLAHAIAGNSCHISAAALNRFWGAMREYARDHDVLISAEPMYRYTMPGHGGPQAAREAYVQAVGEWARDIEVKVLVVYRCPNDFAASMYGEHVLQTRFARRLQDFVRERAHLFDYAWQIGIWQAHVGPVRHLCYERLKRLGIVDAFFEELGVDVRNWRRPRVANPSKDAALVELKRQANAAQISEGDNTRSLKRLNRKRPGKVLTGGAPQGPRTLWHSPHNERAFLHESIEKFVNSPYWNEAEYGHWRTEPAAKIYASIWADSVKSSEALKL